MERLQKQQILKDLNKKIVFIIGPRQVGKTWLAKDIAKNFNKPVYLNYDSIQDKKIIHSESWLNSTDLLIIDELHKMKGWKNYLKGVFDTKPEKMKILVTGSARLATFQKSGDSLAGRFFSHTLLPFSPAELSGTDYNDIKHFLERGGFPEPFLANNLNDANRWRYEYINGLIRTDILDFENIHNLKSIEMVLELLRLRIGSKISYSSIAQDIGISPNTVKKYIQVLEALFIVFRVTPFSKNIARSLMKDPKIYFYDSGMVKGNSGALAENLTATCLLKYVSGKTENTGIKWELNYIRTKDKKEVDFCIVKDSNLEHLVEVKYSNSNLSPTLVNFSQKLDVKGSQVIFNLKREQKKDRIEIRDAFSFLSELSI